MEKEQWKQKTSNKPYSASLLTFSELYSLIMWAYCNTFAHDFDCKPQSHPVNNTLLIEF